MICRFMMFVVLAVLEVTWNMYQPANVAAVIPKVLAFYPESNYASSGVRCCRLLPEFQVVC